MPQGGIIPVKAMDNGPCWVCCRGGTKHFWFEFDTGIHARCALTMKVKSLTEPDPEADLLTDMHLDFTLEDAS